MGTDEVINFRSRIPIKFRGTYVTVSILIIGLLTQTCVEASLDIIGGDRMACIIVSCGLVGPIIVSLSKSPNKGTLICKRLLLQLGLQ